MGKKTKHIFLIINHHTTTEDMDFWLQSNTLPTYYFILICSFMYYLSNKHLLHTYYMGGTMLSTGDSDTVIHSAVLLQACHCAIAGVFRNSGMGPNNYTPASDLGL